MPYSFSPEDSSAVLLRWSDAPDRPWREILAKVLHSDAYGATICSSLRLTEETEVRLLRDRRCDCGIVRACREEGSEFILTIWLTESSVPRSEEPDRDPGVLVVEDFLTEEQEERILAEIACEHHSPQHPTPAEGESEAAKRQPVEKGDEGLRTTLSLIRLFRLARASKARSTLSTPSSSGRQQDSSVLPGERWRKPHVFLWSNKI
jgi:hypothetical protein